MNWISLEDQLPSVDEYAVLLFPSKTDCGPLYIVSNPTYARINALKHGFTHWAKFELAPGHAIEIEHQRSGYLDESHYSEDLEVESVESNMVSPNFVPLPSDVLVYALDEWVDNVLLGIVHVSNYNQGFFIKNGLLSDVSVFSATVPPWATGIAWYPGRDTNK